MNTRNRFSPEEASRSGLVAPALVLIATAIAMTGCTGGPGGSADTRLSASFLAQLPLTLAFRDHGRQEKLSQLPVPLDLGGAPEGSEAAPLTIGYYAPDQSLVLYFRHVGYFTGIVPIGTYENTDAIENQPDGFTVTLREAD